ncbi:CYFA0S04e03708g1_1 [Cyberlindnera fabianii]|uniref:CYFA0S04e03708g1_1 n=1 Tax=Cyberlindnera fabianii TaxID=36022 RepID=A0A061ASG5_CYBFA|nr:CYFA0S04e03708g1_1 [Cyberlindnera fabianii]
MDTSEGFSPIEAIFYTVFHPTEGTKVSHQVPPGSIVPSQKATSAAMSEPLFDFDAVKNYIIPKAPLCNHLLTLKVDQYRIVGFPVSISGSHYARNSFSFNFCFVFKYGDNTLPFENDIRRLGRVFTNLEEQYQILSKKENDLIYFKNVAPLHSNSAPDSVESSPGNDEAGRSSSMDSSFAGSTVGGASTTYEQIMSDLENNINSSTPLGITNKDNMMTLDSVESLIEQIHQDLNNYSECLIPIDSGNSIDIKLLPLLPPPPKICPEDVPITTVHLEGLVDVNWDPTMLKILPFINGINSVKRISLLANADYSVIRSCIQHLMYYKCIIICDIFQFSNTYAPTSDIGLFLTEPDMASECQAYVVAPSIFKGLPYEATPQQKSSDKGGESSSISSRKGSSTLSLPKKAKKDIVVLPSKAKLFYLYRSLHQGQSVKQWYKDHSTDLECVDLRRFITFGVMRGLIYRVHSYPIIDSLITNESAQDALFTNYLESLNLIKTPNGKTAPPITKEPPAFRRKNSTILTDQQREQVVELSKLLKTVRNMDALCTEMNMDRASLEGLLRKVGPYNVVNS